MSRPYKNGTFIYPPRPEHCISSDNLNKFDDNSYIAQCKLNGSCAEIYLNSDKFDIKNRHKGGLSNFKLKDCEILSLHRGNGEMLLIGEYLNKSKKDSNGNLWNHKLVIFDILVYDNEHLLGSTFKERYELLLNIFTTKEYNEYLYQIDENIFLVKSFESDFKKLYHDIVKTDILEGLVLKPKDSMLQPGNKEKNNLCLKCRKETKNYTF